MQGIGHMFKSLEAENHIKIFMRKICLLYRVGVYLDAEILANELRVIKTIFQTDTFLHVRLNGGEEVPCRTADIEDALVLPEILLHAREAARHHRSINIEYLFGGGCLADDWAELLAVFLTRIKLLQISLFSSRKTSPQFAQAKTLRFTPWRSSVRATLNSSEPQR